MMTTVPHLGEFRVRWISMSADFKSHWLCSWIAEQCIDDRLRSVHIGQAIAELKRLCLRQFDAAFTHDAAMMAARATGLQLGENSVEQATLEYLVGLRCQLESPAGIAIEPLSFGQLAHHVLDLLTQFLEAGHVLRGSKFSQLFHVDHANLRCSRSLFELLEQFIDGLELLLDLQGLRNGHALRAGECVLGGQLLNLVEISQVLDQAHQLSGKTIGVVADLIIQSFQQINLALADGLLENASQWAWRIDAFGALVESLLGFLFDGVGFISLQDFSSPFFQQGLQEIDAWPQSSNLAGIEFDCSASSSSVSWR